MRAVTIEQYGDANQLQYSEVDTPKLRKNDLLIEVKATSVNPIY